MINLDTILGASLVVGCALLILILSLRKRSAGGGVLRPLAAFDQLRRAVGLVVEQGKRLHVSIGKTNVVDANAASGLVGLRSLERIAQISFISDRPPVVTSGDASLAILSQDTLRSVYRTNNALEMYEAERGHLTGVTPMSYVAGALPVVSEEDTGANILVGSFGPEVAFLCEAADHQDSFVLAASDSLPAQAALYAAAQEPLIGEEVFAVPAYLEAGPVHKASLHAQDFLRWALTALIVAGSILKLVGLL